MEVLIENIATYTFAALLIGLILYFYLRRHAKHTEHTDEKIEKAKAEGLFEPVSLHPVVSHTMCIGSGACIEACPEKDILGMRKNQAVTINASRCVGHGACVRACPVQAISLFIGTEKRGVELPHVSPSFESNVPMIFIAGELGGMGLIKNAVEQGKQATENLAKKLNRSIPAEYDVIIVGAGPAGIASALSAKKSGLSFLLLEQDTLGGTVYSFPRAKLIMTAPMDIPLYGKIKLTETTKTELLGLWQEILKLNAIEVREQEKVNAITREGGAMKIQTVKGIYTSRGVVLAIGRRGSPRKLGVPGEALEKVYYRLLEPEHIQGKNVLVVGGGDSAIESAMLIAAEGNNVALSYRGESFARVKPQNMERITSAAAEGKVKLLLGSNVREIFPDEVEIKMADGSIQSIENDIVYIFAGGELPSAFLSSVGIEVTKKFGEKML